MRTTPLYLFLLALIVGSHSIPAASAYGQTQSTYHRYEGAIGGLGVVVNLGANGSYYYVKVGQPISLSVMTNTTDSLVATEWSGIDQSGSLTLRKHPDGSLTGVWSSDTTTPHEWSAEKNGWVYGKPKPLRVLPVELHEAYPEGSYRFQIFSLDDSLVREIRNGYTAEVQFSLDATLPTAEWSEPDRAFYTREVASAFGCGGGADLQRCFEHQSREYRDSGIAELLDFAKDWADSDLATMYGPLNYYASYLVSPRYNSGGILSLDVFDEEYTGGAHPNHGTSIVVLDMREHRRLKLTDVLTATKRAMRPLAEEYFRKAQGLGKNDDLSAVLFENHLDINDNFYLTDKGIGFLYQPYEVAAYAYGEVEVFIPFKALKGKLTPWAVKRFGL